MSKDFQIQGMDGVINEIKSLSNDRMKRLEILKILRRQMKPILAAVKSNTPIATKTITGRNGKVYEPENLKKSFAVRTSPIKKYPNVIVGPRKGNSAKNDGFYAFWIEYGAYDIPASNFIRNAAEPLMGSVNTTMSAELERYIYKKSESLNL